MQTGSSRDKPPMNTYWIIKGPGGFRMHDSICICYQRNPLKQLHSSLPEAINVCFFQVSMLQALLESAIVPGSAGGKILRNRRKCRFRKEFLKRFVRKEGGKETSEMFEMIISLHDCNKKKNT